MNKKTILAASIVVVVIIGLFLTVLHPHPASTPREVFSTSISPLNTKDMNVTQGANLLLNLTFTSRVGEHSNPHIENLKLISYDETGPWNITVIQEKVFNYSLSLNQLTIQPFMSNSTVLTINLAQDAPTGRYELNLNLDNIKDEASGITYSESIPIEMTITPK